MKLIVKITLSLFLCFACFQTTIEAGWTKQNSGTLSWLRSVYFTNPARGWIVGSRGTFLATFDGGKTWKQTNRFTEDTILDVYFSDESNGFVLCERDIYGAGDFSPSYLMKTSDGGRSWERISFAEGKERLTRIFFDKKGYGYAVGESGTFWAMQDDKKSWKKLALPVRFLMLGVSFTDERHGSLVGGNGTILFTEDGGMSWNPASVIGGGGSSRTKLNSVFFINQKNGWAVGNQGKIYGTLNGGKSWRELQSNIAQNLTDVFFLNTAEGYAVGDQGTILRTTTAGNLWSVEETNSKHKLERVFFVGQRGFAVGFGGTILIYEAGAESERIRNQPQIQKRN